MIAMILKMNLSAIDSIHHKKKLKYIKSVGQTKVIRQFLLVFYFTQWNIQNVRPLKRSFAKENLAETSESTV